MSVPRCSTITQLQSVQESLVTFADLNTSCLTQQFFQQTVLFLPDGPVFDNTASKGNLPSHSLALLMSFLVNKCNWSVNGCVFEQKLVAIQADPFINIFKKYQVCH